MKTYSVDLRRKLVQAYEHRLGSQRALADAFGVSPSFVKKVLRRYRTTGQLTPKPPTGGQKPRLDATPKPCSRAWCRHSPIAPWRDSALALRLPPASGSAFPPCAVCCSASGSREDQVAPR